MTETKFIFKTAQLITKNNHNRPIQCFYPMQTALAQSSTVQCTASTTQFSPGNKKRSSDGRNPLKTMQIAYQKQM